MRMTRERFEEIHGGTSLEDLVRQIVPYVQATISVGNITGPDGHRPAHQEDEWVRVHHGRLASSRRQLDMLMMAIGEEFLDED
jgi:hypothetical protein